MSDGEQELFDEGFEDTIGVDDLFGQDEANPEDEGVDLEDEGFQDEEPQAAPAPAPVAATNEVSDRRKALLQLAKKAKGGDEAGPRKKKQKSDKAAERGSSRPQRSRRGQHEGSEEQEQQPKERVELNEDEIVETEADKDFIDDDGVAEEDRYEEDLDALRAAAEAEEVEPGLEDEPTSILDEVLQRRKRARKRDADADIEADVMQLVSMMTAMSDTDTKNMDARPPRPAIEKLKHLNEVCSVLRQKKYHEVFLINKGLNAIASWLKPYNNGTLPNAKIRTELVGILKLLQLDTSNDYVRERLEDSELGKIIMFYHKNPNESMTLRADCRDLIQNWSAPIFADSAEEERKRRQRERAHRQRQAAERAERERKEKQEHEEAERRRKLLPREEGFRTRASVPQPSKMDFVINPGKTLDPVETQKVTSGSAGPKNKQSPIGGRLGKMLQQKKRGARDRMGGVSVEGRGIQL